MTVAYSPWRALGAMPHLTLLVTRLPAGRGWWLPDLESVVLDDRLTQAERRSVLQHELEHHLAGDVCCDVGPDGPRQSRRQEERADRRAAARLVTLEALADAIVAGALGDDDVAERLHVDTRTVRARVRALTPPERDYIERRLAARDGAA